MDLTYTFLYTGIKYCIHILFLYTIHSRHNNKLTLTNIYIVKKITKKDFWDCILLIYKYKYVLIWAITTLALAMMTIPLFKLISQGEITSDPAMQLLLIIDISILNIICIGILCILWQPHHVELCNEALEKSRSKTYK